MRPTSHRLAAHRAAEAQAGRPRNGRDPQFAGAEVGDPKSRREVVGFTLIELILVMAMLAAVFAMAAPSLSSFFRGRVLDSEARRFLALTRAGQNRAVSEGVSVLLWMNPAERTYGLWLDPAQEGPQNRLLRPDTNRVSFVLGERLSLAYSGPLLSPDSAVGVAMQMGNQPGYIRFLPDGLIEASSPYLIELREENQGVATIVQTAHRRYYEIRDLNASSTRR